MIIEKYSEDLATYINIVHESCEGRHEFNGYELHVIEAALQQLIETDTKTGIPEDIRDEMDSDMEDSGVAQGEIESCLNHWNNKYVIRMKTC